MFLVNRVDKRWCLDAPSKDDQKGGLLGKVHFLETLEISDEENPESSRDFPEWTNKE